MTTVPTPPPSEPAPSLRPIEEPCGFAIIDDGEVRPCERPATGWRWYQDCGHEDMLAMACDQHENEGGRRLRAAEETLARATSLDTLFDVLLEAQYGGMRPGADEREAVAQLAEAVQPLLRAALAEGASR